MSNRDAEINYKSMWNEVVANRAKLDTCRAHKFRKEDIGKGLSLLFGADVECLVCGGRMKLLDANQYARGYKAAGGDPNDVIPGFEPEETVEEQAHHALIEREFFGDEETEKLTEVTQEQLDKAKRSIGKCLCSGFHRSVNCPVHGRSR